MQLRVATHADADGIAALVHSAYRSDESRQGWTTEADLVGGQRVDPCMVREIIDTPDNVVLVLDGDAGGDTSPLACCHVERVGGGAHLGMFAVRPGRQGQGLGRRVLDAAEEWAVGTWAVDHLEIMVLAGRPELLAWYARRGFVLTGTEHPFPYADERYGQPRRDDLVLLGMRRRRS